MEDYLDEDPTIKSQQFVCISLFIPGKEEEGDDQDSRCGIKIRGSYATMEQAEKRVEELKATDKLHHIYVGDVGKWLPFNPRPEESGKEIYPDKELNELMKNYKENRVKCNEVHEERANTMMNEAKKDNTQMNKKKKKKKKKASTPNSIQDASDITYLGESTLGHSENPMSIDVDSDEVLSKPPLIAKHESVDDVLKSHLNDLSSKVQAI